MYKERYRHIGYMMVSFLADGIFNNQTRLHSQLPKRRLKSPSTRFINHKTYFRKNNIKHIFFPTATDSPKSKSSYIHISCIYK